MAVTYEKIATNTLGSNTATVTFSSIPSTYTDLVLIMSTRVDTTSIDYFSMRINGDTGTNYSLTYLQGNGSSATSGRYSSLSQGIVGWSSSRAENAANYSTQIVNIQNYANTTTYKTYLTRSNESTQWVYAEAGLWRSTAAINSLTLGTWGSGSFGSSNIFAGSTFTLYGIKAA